MKREKDEKRCEAKKKIEKRREEKKREKRKGKVWQTIMKMTSYLEKKREHFKINRPLNL